MDGHQARRLVRGLLLGAYGGAFALGVMSIGWMAFIAALIAIEKLLPWRVIASRGVAVILLVLGLSVALLPDDVPDVKRPAPDMQMAVT